MHEFGLVFTKGAKFGVVYSMQPFCCCLITYMVWHANIEVSALQKGQVIPAFHPSSVSMFSML